jgi:alkylhydroperoxidase family enzyme
MDYAVEMTSTPVEVPDALFDALKARLDEAQLLELTSAVGWENYRARTTHALGIGAAGFSEGAACAVPYRAAAGT